jgi:ankyrin repeat protein
VAGQTGRTALHHAASTGNIPIACVLLAKEDLDPNVRDDQGWPPLTYAAFNGNLRMVELFLAREDIQVNVQQVPPLFHAAKKGHVEVVRRLLQLDTIDVNQQFWNSTPLCVASEIGHPEVTTLLLEHNKPPDINLKTYIRDTALSLAAYHGHLAIINLLLEENGLDVTATDKFRDTALCKAARNGYEHVVKRLYRDTRAKCVSDVKRAIEAASHVSIALYLEGHLNEEGNFCTWP